MKRTKQLVLALCALTLALLCCACGAKEASAASAPAASAPEGGAAMDMEMNLEMEAAPMEPQAPEPEDDSGSSGSVYRDADAKLIREASLNIQTTEFDPAVESLERLVEQSGGYFQSAAVYGGSYRDVNANRCGEYVVRIPADQYGAFLGQAGGLGYVTSKNESSEDIGEQYYDAETRLRTQKTKQERLLALLEKAETMEDIISLENALSDVEYQIEQYSSTLNRYDSLVDFSTIYLTLEEVVKISEETGAAEGLGTRMAAGFAASADGLARGFQEFLVWASYHIFGLLIGAAVIGGGVTLSVRSVRKQKKEIQKQRENTGK